MIILLFIISFFLLTLNVLGLFNRHYKKIPELFKHQPIFGRTLNFITRDDLSRTPQETEQDYCYKIFNTISRHIIHYQPECNDSVPYTVNWILALLYYSNFAYFKFYEFYNGTKAVQKGYGLCSQFSIILWYYLSKAKICCYVVRLNGHVINEVHFKTDQVWTIDADYQIIIPLSVKDLHKNPDLICNYYKVSAGKMQTLINIYKQTSVPLSQKNMIARLWSENLLFFLNGLFQF